MKAKRWVSSRGSKEAPNPSQNPLLAPRNPKPPRPPKSPVWTAPSRYPDRPPRTSPFSSLGLYLLLRIRLLLPGSAPYPTTSSLAAGKSCRRVIPTLLSFALYFNWAFQTGLVKRDPFLQFFFPRVWNLCFKRMSIILPSSNYVVLCALDIYDTFQ